MPSSVVLHPTSANPQFHRVLGGLKMGKKKFIDKKKAATFQLFARDSSDPNYSAETPGGDRVFVRVDNNPVSINVFEDQNDNDSRFADAPDDDDESCPGYDNLIGVPTTGAPSGAAPLPDDVRREILELGFPDDGYNYLFHLREIKNTSGGSLFYHNPKFSLDPVWRDVKAYDASRVSVSAAEADKKDASVYSVASKTVNVRVQKAVDPEVAALLDDNDLSRFASDVEDLEEDFVVRANMLEGETAGGDEKLNSSMQLEGFSQVVRAPFESGSGKVIDELMNKELEEQPPTRRLLDEQFDMLELKEYGTDNEGDYNCYMGDEELLADKLKDACKDQQVDDLELEEVYIAPADLLHGNERPISKELVDSAADVLRRCAEYAEKYENESGNEVDVVVEESSEESEQWDCETIVTTYSNLDNHPGKIEAPMVARKKKLAEAVSGALNVTNHAIALRGKEKLPVEFLPHRRAGFEKLKDTSSLKVELQKRKQHEPESKDEKKERKAAVKEERREARQLKKEMKGLYKFEAQRAQRVSAVAGPSSIHLM